ncbi:cation-translocating P-type ATPase [Thalassovita taeanensis]|uniref:Ca2+-transporting ATPase n=1 Tax=Thalassovita taeanensis TaxID=657014 RepID=A0A1H9IFY3_9RHOB|nr:cation-transporting P-type ATPase [Thalassovita taeanensis]SEQ73437.1 Ca2+-transporting ATPase [Thalassovita taeanensis]
MSDAKAPAPTQGLTDSEIAPLQARYGRNEIVHDTRFRGLRILVRQFTSVLVVVLIVAMAAAFAMGEIVDAAAIGIVVVMNALLGFAQEWRTDNAIKSLRRMLSPTAHVIRGGQEKSIPATELVPGDLVLIEQGSRIPADMTLIEHAGLQVDESALSGESDHVDKTAGLGEPNLFMGTTVTTGRGKAIVTAIGALTKFGQIAGLTSTISERPTVLQIQMARLAMQIAILAVVIAGATVAIGYFTGRDLFVMVMTGLSLAVSLVPEGLPVVLTISLTLGATAMARQKALVRQLQAVETLGAATVICTDKTGTLTENRMTAVRIWTLGAEYQVTGTGSDPAGHITRNGRKCRAADDPELANLLETALLCNNARLEQAQNTWAMFGSPTEGALVTLAYKGWATLPTPERLVAENPFSSERKRMSMLVRTDDSFALHAKGAPEHILSVCNSAVIDQKTYPLDDELRSKIMASYHQMAENGLRVIGLAARAAQDGDTEERDMIFQGLVGLIDPPRPEVGAAIQACRAAGIQVIMITGDGPTTARAIAQQLGLPARIALTGAELEDMTDADLTEVLGRDVLFARTTPAHKLRIVTALQARGETVAMTGDGVNDAPALKRADIGIAMGQRGTDVARDSSDLVLLDDNFATIVGAIAQGRRQFENISKFARYLLSSNAGEAVALFGAILMGLPLIFLPSQILWINLVTDGISAVALGLEKAEPGQMQDPPRGRNATILGRTGLWMILLLGAYTGGASIWIFQSLLAEGEIIARTTTFTALVIFELAAVFAFRSFRVPCTSLGWLSNRYLFLAVLLGLGTQLAAIYWPPLQLLLRTQPIGWEHWQLVGLFTLPLIIVPELIKAILASRARSGKAAPAA